MFKKASGIILWFLVRFGYGGITMPWGIAYFKPERLHELGLQAHEAVHLMQIARDGRVRWTVTYLWYNLRYGYKDNPYEVEARTLSGVA